MGLVAKKDPFSIFWKVISRKPLDLHRGKFAQICFQALSARVPNFIEIGGVTRKPLVDLTWNDSAVKVSLTTLVVHASVLEVRWAAGDIIGLSNYHTTSGAQ